MFHADCSAAGEADAIHRHRILERNLPFIHQLEEHGRGERFGERRKVVCGRVGGDALRSDIGEPESLCPHDLLAFGNNGGDSRDVSVVTQCFESLLEFRDRAGRREGASTAAGYGSCDNRKREKNRNLF
jgi:hypothetical protein